MLFRSVTKRLVNDINYKPQDKTFQSTLSSSDIQAKLKDYVKVKTKDVLKIPLGTHIRYISINPKTNEKLFRLGGVLTKIGENNEYIICSNGTFSWSVQLKLSEIYKKLSVNEQVKIATDNMNIHNNSIISNLQIKNNKLKDIIKEIKNTTTDNINKKKSNIV